MKRNGSFFLSEVSRSCLQPGVWTPYAYREQRHAECLEHFATVRKIRGIASSSVASKYAPIEYRHIPPGTNPTFALEPVRQAAAHKVDAVGEKCLLFGTMRAYLGNVLVTPRAEWIGERSPFFFSVKSEFVQIVPKDGLVYFWWAFLRSPIFLHGLPIGTGGTRPRLDPAHLGQMPVDVPGQSVRKEIDRQLVSYAETTWQQYVSVERLLSATMS